MARTDRRADVGGPDDAAVSCRDPDAGSLEHAGRERRGRASRGGRIVDLAELGQLAARMGIGHRGTGGRSDPPCLDATPDPAVERAATGVAEQLTIVQPHHTLELTVEHLLGTRGRGRHPIAESRGGLAVPIDDLATRGRSNRLAIGSRQHEAAAGEAARPAAGVGQSRDAGAGGQRASGTLDGKRGSPL